MTTDQLEAASPASDQHSRRVRKLLWIVGLCLWILAGFGIYASWKARQAGGESATAPDEGQSPPGTTVGGGNGGGLKAIVLEPSDDPAAPATAWDPGGIQDFSLTERSGRQVTKQDLLGRPWAVCFVFTRCLGTCLTITGKMHELQKGTAGSDVRLVSLSVDPEYDTPEELRKYAEAFGADPDRWLFLTGDKERIYRLIQESFRLPVKELTGPDRKPGFEVLHSNFILHVNAEGVVVGKYTGTDDADVAKLRRELLKDAKRSTPAGSGSEGADGVSRKSGT
ncbi:MAG TPA: SCO family protein [Planctomycetaceae bacterium]|nr:SCO family protein [Planctomycetaceae bacterium]